MICTDLEEYPYGKILYSEEEIDQLTKRLNPQTKNYLLADWEIKQLIDIQPFSEGEYTPGVISHGVSSYGYDLRISDEFKIFTNVHNVQVDPKNFNEKGFVDFKGPQCIIPPNSFALGRTVERIKMPRDVLAICMGKSTYARCGIIVNVTPIEPEWEGYITIEISNTTPLPAVIYSFEGIAQLVFLRANTPCQKSYADKKGKYQNQKNITLPK
jgi:dCTP deaminase